MSNSTGNVYCIHRWFSGRGIYWLSSRITWRMRSRNSRKRERGNMIRPDGIRKQPTSEFPWQRFLIFHWKGRNSHFFRDIYWRFDDRGSHKSFFFLGRFYRSRRVTTVIQEQVPMTRIFVNETEKMFRRLQLLKSLLYDCVGTRFSFAT